MIRETVVNNSENRAERKSGGKKRKGRKHPHKGNEAQNLSVAPRKNGVNNKIERRNEV